MVSAPEVPNSLELVIDFVNTLDPDEPSDALSTPEGVESWLAGRGLLDAASLPLNEKDRRGAVALREALRAQMLAHNGAEADERAALELDEVACRGELGVQFNSDG